MMRFDTAFPPLGYLPPSNPTAYNEWKLSIQGDVVEEEGAPWFREDLARFYVQDFRRADWAPNFKKELRRRRNEGRLWAEPTWTLPEDTKQELDIFAEHLPPVPPVATPFPWGLLPNELKIRVINMLFRYTETLKVTAFAIVKPPGTASSTTPAEEVASSRYAFRLVAKAPKALIPQRLSKVLNVHKYGPRYWRLDKPSVLLAARTVSKEFDALISEAFFGGNTFELHDNTATLTRLHLAGEYLVVCCFRVLRQTAQTTPALSLIDGSN